MVKADEDSDSEVRFAIGETHVARSRPHGSRNGATQKCAYLGNHVSGDVNVWLNRFVEGTRTLQAARNRSTGSGLESSSKLQYRQVVSIDFPGSAPATPSPYTRAIRTSSCVSSETR